MSKPALAFSADDHDAVLDLFLAGHEADVHPHVLREAVALLRSENRDMASALAEPPAAEDLFLAWRQNGSASELAGTIRELVLLERQAKPGPWEWACDFGIGDDRHWYVQQNDEPDEPVCLGLVSIATDKWSRSHYPTPEMRYLVAARNAVPALLREMQRLSRELAATRKERLR